MYMYILAFSCSGYTLIYLAPPGNTKFSKDIKCVCNISIIISV